MPFPRKKHELDTRPCRDALLLLEFTNFPLDRSSPGFCREFQEGRVRNFRHPAGDWASGNLLLGPCRRKEVRLIRDLRGYRVKNETKALTRIPGDVTCCCLASNRHVIARGRWLVVTLERTVTSPENR